MADPTDTHGSEDPLILGMSCQCTAKHDARYGEATDAYRIDADSLKQEIVEKDLLIMILISNWGTFSRFLCRLLSMY